MTEKYEQQQQATQNKDIRTPWIQVTQIQHACAPIPSSDNAEQAVPQSVRTWPKQRSICP